MAAIAADSGNEKKWGRAVSFNLSSGLGYIEKARKVATNTVQVSQNMLWSTSKAAWVAGTTLLVLAMPLFIKMDQEAQIVDLEGGETSLIGEVSPATPKSSPIK
uniref:Uncharacterized protein n=1 Tax=Physcomitrium patens TaxID=3218 RepID=A0A2K1KV01_PHYPA|nr:hypothetical protein PHYPA_004611 [Physcomitrium patens]